MDALYPLSPGLAIFLLIVSVLMTRLLVILNRIYTQTTRIADVLEKSNYKYVKESSPISVPILEMIVPGLRKSGKDSGNVVSMKDFKDRKEKEPK